MEKEKEKNHSCFAFLLFSPVEKHKEEVCMFSRIVQCSVLRGVLSQAPVFINQGIVVYPVAPVPVFAYMYDPPGTLAVRVPQSVRTCICVCVCVCV